MKLQEFASVAYYINLDCRPERREAFEAEMARVGLAGYAQRISAIDATHTDREATPHARAEACGRSHQKVIAAAQQAKLERVVVFEDDIRFYDRGATPGLHIIEAALDELQSIPDWDVFYLGGFAYSDEAVQVSPHIFRISRILGSHGLIVRSRVYADFLDSFEPQHTPIDIWLSTATNIAKYVAYPLAAIQAEYPSDVSLFPLPPLTVTYIDNYNALAQKASM